MTLDELNEMTDRELDAIAAERVMGLGLVEMVPAWIDPGDGSLNYSQRDHERGTTSEGGIQPATTRDYGDGSKTYDIVPLYTADLNLAAQVEVMAAGLDAKRYARMVERTTGADALPSCWVVDFKLIRATARQRVTAAILCCAGETK